MKNKKGTVAIILFFIAITALFFTYQIVITYDTSHYLWLTSLLTPEGDFSTWDVARGPVFPMFIRICNILFGQSSNGILIGMFAFYLIMLTGCYFIYKDTIKEECFSKKMKWILGILFALLVVVNPMIIGYYHTLLTEFVGITFAIIGCYLAWKWMHLNFKEDKLKYSIYTIIIAVLTAIAWQLKQPYVGTILFPVVIAAMISFVRNVNLKNFVQRGITLLICAVMLMMSLKIWDMVLKAKNVDVKQDRTSAGFFATGILSGLKEYDIQAVEKFDSVQKIEESKKIIEEDKKTMKEILEKKSEYKSFIVVDTKQENYEIIYTKEIAMSTGEATKFWISSFTKEPTLIVGNYITNYFATISVYPIEFEGMKIVIKKQWDLKNTAEIETIGFKIYEYGNETVFPLSTEYEPYTEPYRTTNKPIVAINWVMRNLQLPNIIVMKVAYLLLPILMIISMVTVFRTKRRYAEKYTQIIDMITILYTFSFLQILIHALLGSTIDRYTMPALTTTMIGILLSIYAIVYRKKYKIENEKKTIGKEEKIKNEKM